MRLTRGGGETAAQCGFPHDPEDPDQSRPVDSTRLDWSVFFFFLILLFCVVESDGRRGAGRGERSNIFPTTNLLEVVTVSPTQICH